jgi:hypothetical protein
VVVLRPEAVPTTRARRRFANWTASVHTAPLAPNIPLP